MSSAIDALTAIPEDDPTCPSFLTALQKTTAELHAIRQALDEERRARQKDINELSALREERHTLVLFLTRLSPDSRTISVAGTDCSLQPKCLHDLISDVENSVTADRQLLIAAHNELRVASATTHELRQEVRDLRTANEALSTVAIDAAEALRALHAVAPLLAREAATRASSQSTLALRDRSSSYPRSQSAHGDPPTPQRSSGHPARTADPAVGRGSRVTTVATTSGDASSPTPRMVVPPIVQGALQVLMPSAMTAPALLTTAMAVVDSALAIKDALAAARGAAVAAAHDAKATAAQLGDAVAAATEGERAALVANAALAARVKDLHARLEAAEAAAAAAARRAAAAEGMVGEAAVAAERAARVAQERYEHLEASRAAAAAEAGGLAEQLATALALGEERERRLEAAQSALASVRHDADVARGVAEEARDGAARAARAADAAARKREGDLVAERADLETKLRTERADVERLSKQVAAAKLTIGALEGDVARAAAELHSVRCAAESATALARRAALEVEQLQAARADAVADAERLRRRLDGEREGREAVAVRLTGAETAADDLRAQVQDLQRRAADEGQRAETAEHALAHARDMVVEVEKLLATEREARARADQRLKDHDGALETLQRRERELTSEAANVKADLDAAVAATRALDDERTRLRRQLQQEETAARSLTAKVRDLETALAAATERAARAADDLSTTERHREAAVSDLKGEREALERTRRDLAATQEGLRQAEVRSVDIASELRAVREALRAAQEELTAIRNDRDAVTEAARLLRIEAGRTARALESERDARALAEKRAGDAETAAATLRESGVASERALAHAKRSAAEGEAERAALVEQLTRLRKTHGATKDMLRSVEVRLEELESRVTSLRATEARLLEEVKALTAERDDAVALRRSFEVENERLGRVLHAERTRRRDLQTALADAAMDPPTGPSCGVHVSAVSQADAFAHGDNMLRSWSVGSGPAVRRPSVPHVHHPPSGAAAPPGAAAQSLYASPAPRILAPPAGSAGGAADSPPRGGVHLGSSSSSMLGGVGAPPVVGDPDVADADVPTRRTADPMDPHTPTAPAAGGGEGAFRYDVYGNRFSQAHDAGADGAVWAQAMSHHDAGEAGGDAGSGLLAHPHAVSSVAVVPQSPGSDAAATGGAELDVMQRWRVPAQAAAGGADIGASDGSSALAGEDAGWTGKGVDTVASESIEDVLSARAAALLRAGMNGGLEN